MQWPIARRTRLPPPPRYCAVTSGVTSPSHCPAPVGHDLKVHDLPASDAAVPVAVGQRPFPEAVKPVTFPSVIVSASFPSVSSKVARAPGLRMTPLSKSILAFVPSHSQISWAVVRAPSNTPPALRQLAVRTVILWPSRSPSGSGVPLPPTT